MKQQQLLKKTILFILFFAVATVVINELLKAMDLNLRNRKPFKYQGKTPKSDWYNWIEPLAKSVGKEFGIPWQAILVQTALETGWGKSQLATKYNNFSGVKYAGSGAPNKVNMKTVEVFNGNAVTINSDFAAWPNPYDGLRGYANFFHRNKRYAQALKYPTDPYKFIEEIKKAGYATGPNYISILHGMLQNDLKIQRA